MLYKLPSYLNNAKFWIFVNNGIEGRDNFVGVVVHSVLFVEPLDLLFGEMFILSPKKVVRVPAADCC